MAGLFNILKVTVSEDKICAHVLVNPGMPLMTSEDIEATARVYYLVPAIAKHLCLGDSGREFQDCMGQTELCHLLEHVTVELMNETGLAGSISCGRTRVSEHDERVFEVELSCPDDALAIGALSSATFMMDWAFLHADQPAPDVDGTVAGLRNLVLGMRAEAEGKDGHKLTLKMPKLKGMRFATAVIERRKRRETSVEEAIIEMRLAGVSTRRIEDVSEILWGAGVSAGTVSNLNDKAFKAVEEWRSNTRTSTSTAST